MLPRASTLPQYTRSAVRYSMNSARSCVREGHDRDRRQKPDSQPCKIAVRALQLIQLRLLRDPENSERQKAHRVHDEARQEPEQRMPELAFGVNRPDRRNTNVEHEQRHRKCKYAIAERAQALKSGACDSIVGILVAERSRIAPMRAQQ